MMIVFYIYFYVMVFSIFMVVAGPWIGLDINKYEHRYQKILCSTYYMVFLFFPLLTIYILFGIYEGAGYVWEQAKTDWKIYADSWKR